jgi:hypothetical protein
MTTEPERQSRVPARRCGKVAQGRPKGNGVWARRPVWVGWREPVRKNSDIL